MTGESGVNAVRGETTLIVDGTPRRLCLTLGALAEIETALGVAGPALADRLRNASARDLAAVLAALMRGGGEAADETLLARAAVTPAAAAAAIGRAFTLAARG